MRPGDILNHGDPSTWDYLGKREVPATGPGFEPGTTKVYHGWIDENGFQVEYHYHVGPDGTIFEEKFKPIGTTDFGK
jgi:hypothetical protein